MRMQATLTDIIHNTSLSAMLNSIPRYHTNYIIQKFAMNFVDKHHELIKQALLFDGDDLTGEEDAYVIDITDGMIASIIEEDWASSEEAQQIADQIMAGINQCYRDPIMELEGCDCLKLIKRFPVWEWNETIYSIKELAVMCVKDALLDTDWNYFVNQIASYFVFKYWNEGE